MTSWDERSRLRRAYLNPALTGALVVGAASAYESRRGPMPFALAFLVAPLVLHKPTRESLPSSTRTHLSTWISRDQLFRVTFPLRAESLVPVVNEGIRYAIRTGDLTLQRGELVGRALSDPEGEPARSMMQAARLVGRWLAKNDQPSTTFALLGVRP